MGRKYGIAVCDDEKIALDVISTAVKSIFSTHELTCDIEKFYTVGDLESRMESRVFDLLILDIEMPGGDGIDFGKKLRKENSGVAIIFASNRVDRVFESFESHPFAFIRKSNLIEDAERSIDMFIESTAVARDDKLVLFKKRGGIGSYVADEIMYIEGSRNVQILHLCGKPDETVRSSLTELYDKLDKVGFYRAQKGFIVNFLYVKDIVGESIVLRDGTTIPVSRGTGGTLKLKYMAYLQSHNILIDGD